MKTKGKCFQVKYGIILAVISLGVLNLLAACAGSLPTLSSGTPTPMDRPNALPASASNIKAETEPTTTRLTFATIPVGPIPTYQPQVFKAVTPTPNDFDGSYINIVGSSIVPASAMKVLLARHNPNPPSANIIDMYYALEPYWRIRADVLICQMFHETGYLTSWWSQPPRRNMAGLGVSGETSATSKQGDPAWQPGDEGNWRKGYAFKDWESAINAHFAHMSAYVYSQEYHNASQLSPGYRGAVAYIASLKRAKPISVLNDLNGIWAVPGNGYGQRIADIMKTAFNLTDGKR